jgi:hypothetical protein
MTKVTIDTETTAVVAQDVSLAPVNPTVGRGFENVDMDQISMPRAKLLQSNSPEVSDRDYNFRAGDLIHTMMMEKVAEKFVPLSIWNSNVFFAPRVEEKKIAIKALLGLSDEDVNGMVICKAVDGKHGSRYGGCASCGKHKFVGNDKPLCNETINVLCAPLEDDGSTGLPFVIQFSNTSFKHGKKFRDTAFYSSLGGDLFGKVYKFDSFEAAGNGNKWFELKVKPAGTVPDEMKPQFEALYRTFAGKVVVVEDEVEAEGTVAY